MLREKFVALNICIRKEDLKSKIYASTLERTRPKTSRRKEILIIRAEISQIEHKKSIEKINKAKKLVL